MRISQFSKYSLWVEWPNIVTVLLLVFDIVSMEAKMIPTHEISFVDNATENILGPLILMTKYCLLICAFIFDSSISLTYSWGKLQNSHIKTISRKASLLSKLLCSNIILTIPRLQRLYFLGSFSDKEFTALSWPPLGRSWRWQWWWWWWWYSQYRRSPSCWCCQ